MLNLDYRRQRRTAHKFRTTPAEAAAEFERLYPEAVARAREKRLRPQKKRMPWSTSFSVEDGD